MAMEITSNYSNYVANYTNTMKKADSNSVAEVKTNTSANSKDKVQEYYEKLCKKFPNITLKQYLPGSQKSADYPYQAFSYVFKLD